MATMQQIEDALRKADASGNVEDARRLAKALTDMRRASATETNKSKPPREAPSGGDQSIVSGILDSFTEGAAFGFGDELTALEAAVLGKTPDGEWFDYGQSFGDRYDDALNAERGQNEAFRDEHPVISTAAEIGGGVASAFTPIGAVGQTIGKPLTLANAGRSATAGAGYGAAYGYGSGEGGAANRARNAVDSAVYGAAGGVAALPVQAAAGRLTKNLLASRAKKAAEKATGISRETGDILAPAVRNADADIATGGAAYIRKGGREAMLGDALPQHLDYVTNVGPGAPIARQNLGQRVDNAALDVATATNRTLGEPRGKREIVKEIMDTTRANRGDAYAEAFDAPIDYSTEAGQKIESLIRRMDSATLKAAMREAEAEMLYNGVTSRQFKIDIDDQGGLTIGEMPNVLQMDYLKRALNDIAQQGVDKINGTTTRASQRASGLAREIRDALAENSESYSAAMTAGRDAITQREGREIGAKLLANNTYVEDIADAVKTMEHPDLARVKQGLRSEMAHRLGNVRRVRSDPNTDQRAAWVAISDVLTDNNKEKLRVVLGNAEAQRYFDALETAARSFQVRASAAGNSATEPRRVVGEAIDGVVNRGRVPDRPVSNIIDQVGSIPARGLNYLRGASTGQIGSRRDQTLREMAELLTGKRGEEAVAAFEALLKMSSQLANIPQHGGRYTQMLGRVPRVAAGPVAPLLPSPIERQK